MPQECKRSGMAPTRAHKLVLVAVLAAPPCAAFAPFARSHRLAHTTRRALVVASEESNYEPPASEPPAPAAGAAEDSGSLQDVAIGGALYVLLQTIGLSAAQVAGVDARAAAAAVRLVATGGFVLALEASGTVPASDYIRGPSAEPRFKLLGSPLAPLACGGAFFVAVLAATLAAGGELPAAAPLELGRVADVLLAAPLSEEAFFRGFLLTGLARAGVPAAGGIAASAASFALWHAGLPDGGGGPVFFLGLGAYLALLYEGGGRSLGLAVGTHAVFNGLVTLLRAAQA